MIQDDRIKLLNDKKVSGGSFVLYWMQASQRVEYNHALQYAIRKANEFRKPLVAYFGITDKFPNANARHYHFMLEGLNEIERELKERNILFVIRHESPQYGVVELAEYAVLLVTDRGYLRIQKHWRHYVATHAMCPVIQVETDVVVPVEVVSGKEEYAAATIRSKIHRHLNAFIKPLDDIAPDISSLNMGFNSIDISCIDGFLTHCSVDTSVAPVSGYCGGTSCAKKWLKEFIDKKLDLFSQVRNDPTQDALSNMSPYLHFGQISPLYIALQVIQAKGSGVDAYLEELIVRRELSMNFVNYNDRYDSFDALPGWARMTLEEHAGDTREYVYDLCQLEKAQTHDKYWNAAQTEMVVTGKMHGYMRMYWGKKIIEWTSSPAQAYDTAIYLNDKYELDGRDPNGFTGVSWCFGKHDRAWKERPVFGKVRYMNASGLLRKFDADAYARRILQ
ncbi:MAG: deoxyribodipyrimidine photo-lyase [Candidatus Auribacterota bacterium]|jgi:deoxyribodipyrimidine photo-lyase|nr:deoxyribodipyrimidine photo-lyase [Candidatus Auribacterota bacterium]